MPNQMSPDSRRINFIWDKETYDTLAALAKKGRMSVGEFIRRALEEKYLIEPSNPIINIRQSAPSEKFDSPPRTARAPKNPGKKTPPPKNSRRKR